MREDFFLLVNAVSKQENKDLDEETLYFLEKKNMDFFRNGLQLEGWDESSTL